MKRSRLIQELTGVGWLVGSANPRYLESYKHITPVSHKRDRGFAEGQVTARWKMLQWVALLLHFTILSPVFL